MYVAAICVDHLDSATLRMDTHPAHLEFLKELGPKLKLGCALMNDAADMPEGSLIVPEAEAITADDPYDKAGLFASVTLKPWNRFIGNPDLPQN